MQFDNVQVSKKISKQEKENCIQPIFLFPNIQNKEVIGVGWLSKLSNKYNHGFQKNKVTTSPTYNHSSQKCKNQF
jgi:hypothetical protein